MTLDPRLAELADSHAVAIHVGGRFKGSGFVLTPELVVTCAHVVEEAADEVLVRISGSADRTGTVIARHPPRRGGGEYYDSPDIALVSLGERLDRQGVWLAEEPPQAGAVVVARGFSRFTAEPGVQRDSLSMTVRGPAGSLLGVKEDRIEVGLSGALVLDTTTGRVCGMVKASRKLEEVQGGWIVPAHVIAEHTAAAVDENPHRPGTAWFDLASRRSELHAQLFGADRHPARVAAPRPDRPPSWWLQTANEVVPFIARPELDDLLAWCLREDGMGMRLVTAPGGSGKTRLAMRLCQVLDEQGWIAGFLPGDSHETVPHIWEALDAGYRVLVVVDYAETRTDLNKALLTALEQEEPGRVRVLLLARSDGLWWNSLKNGDVVDGTPVRLSPLGERTGPGPVLSAAWQAFHAAIIGEPTPAPPALPEADGPDDVLSLHALALDAVLARRDGVRVGSWDPLGRVLRHEQKYWTDLAQEHEAPLPVKDASVRRVLLLPALFSAASAEQAQAALGRLETVPENALAGAADVLHRLYPHPGLYWAPLQPDRLAEQLLSQVIDDAGSAEASVGLLTSVLADCTFAQAEQAMTVLDRTRVALHRRGSHEPATWLTQSMGTLIRTRPLDFLPPAAGVLSPGTPGWNVFREVLESADYVDVLLPLHQRVARTGRNSEMVHAILGALLLRYDRSVSSRIWASKGGERAAQLLQAVWEIANFFAARGEPEHAWLHSRTAAAFAAKLARADPDTYGPVHAACLDVLGYRLVELDRYRPALRVARRAVKVRRALARRDPAHRPLLAQALTRLGSLLATTGKPDAALRASEEAAGIALGLAREDQQGWAGLVTAVYNNYGLLLSGAGRQAEAEEAAKVLANAVAVSDAQPWTPAQRAGLKPYRRTVARLLARESITDYSLMLTAAEYPEETDDDPR
ncbi:trypsin-like peptidase domain-containing protein [Streptomyces camelliae]|uniref:Trypsin-like peptidase domain-containing protein n=1 Tax=Streptomyces camelliae TaxID=3004093 RepID=A0ABY7NWX4_9ACTN|nr:trypsin-like peptidase domain-containing protein [Streptomyces sp. HUAS 2-6]WBO62716.1 trypsin-like peptidase domain-containing protein [Streptomyces sp. HUAS 2-6]